MQRMLEQEELWLPGVAREEVREALGQLYRTGDPACLAPYLRGVGGEDLCDVTLVSEECQSDPRLPVIGDALEVPSVTVIHDGIKEVPRDPEIDFPQVIGSRPSLLVVGEDNKSTTLEYYKETKIQAKQTIGLRNVEPVLMIFQTSVTCVNMFQTNQIRTLLEFTKMPCILV